MGSMADAITHCSSVFDSARGHGLRDESRDLARIAPGCGAARERTSLTTCRVGGRPRTMVMERAYRRGVDDCRRTHDVWPRKKHAFSTGGTRPHDCAGGLGAY